MRAASTEQANNKGPGYTELISRDADEVVEILSRQLAPHRLFPRDPGQYMQARVATLALGPALLVDVGYGVDVDVHALEFTEQYLVHAAIAGETQIRTRDRLITMHRENVPISCVGTQPRFLMTSACRHLVMRIERKALETYFSRALDRHIAEPVIFGPQTEEDASFSRAWRALLTVLQEQAAVFPQLMARGRMQSHFVSVLLEMLLQNAHHNYSPLLEREPSSAASPWHIRHACDAIESRLSEPLSVANVAREVGVSVRCLQNGFRRSLGMTPMQFIRERRLERLHASLQAAGPSASVTDLMLECGIVNFGRFARYYRYRFGCRPSETLGKKKAC